MTALKKQENELNFKTNALYLNDNLKVLRGINDNCVDLIYLDPPFNSDVKYDTFNTVGEKLKVSATFKDIWELSEVEMEWMRNLKEMRDNGELKDGHVCLYEVISSSQYAHSDRMMCYLVNMTVRLLELHRVLKKRDGELVGSIYLHCDPTASHYLKIIMDCVLKDAFQADITWKRTFGRSDRVFGSVSDHVLFYGAKPQIKDEVRVLRDEESLENDYRHKDKRGGFQPISLTGSKTAEGESGRPWRGHDPNKVGQGRCWSVPKRGKNYEYIVSQSPEYANIEGIHNRLDFLHENDFLYYGKDGKHFPRLKSYKEAHAAGMLPNNFWEDIEREYGRAWGDIAPVGRKESVNFPTQKPIKLLERIIQASSKEGDVVLDPYCGCSTTLVAAEKLGRKWVGIDYMPLSVSKLYERMNEADVQIVRDSPERTDGGRPREDAFSKRHLLTCQEDVGRNKGKKKLFLRQKGVCNGCFYGHFGCRPMDIDHIHPLADGGEDVSENKQVLCPSCNGTKSDKTMEYLWDANKEVEGGIHPDYREKTSEDLWDILEKERGTKRPG